VQKLLSSLFPYQEEAEKSQCFMHRLNQILDLTQYQWPIWAPIGRKTTHLSNFYQINFYQTKNVLKGLGFPPDWNLC
jgi:hypothetical protein